MTTNACAIHEAALSALLDGELEPAEAPPAVDHLLACAACRDFYRRARALDRAVALAGGPAALPPAPPAVWERIVTAAELRPRARRLGRWFLAAAAALAIAVSAWGLDALAPVLGGGDERVDVVLGADRGRMTEERFVRLAVEMLQADSRYRDAMRAVLTAAESESGGEGEHAEGGLASENLMLLRGPGERPLRPRTF